MNEWMNEWMKGSNPLWWLASELIELTTTLIHRLFRLGSHICVSCAWSNPATHHPQTYMQAVDLKTPCGCAFVNHEVLSDWDQLFQSKMTQVRGTSHGGEGGDPVPRSVGTGILSGLKSRNKWTEKNKEKKKTKQILLVKYATKYFNFNSRTLIFDLPWFKS